MRDHTNFVLEDNKDSSYKPKLVAMDPPVLPTLEPDDERKQEKKSQEQT